MGMDKYLNIPMTSDLYLLFNCKSLKLAHEVKGLKNFFKSHHFNLFYEGSSKKHFSARISISDLEFQRSIFYNFFMFLLCK